MDFEDYSDLFQHLPPPSRDKIRLLCDQSEAALDAVHAASQRAVDAHDDLNRVKMVVAAQERAAGHASRRIGFSFTADEVLALREPVADDVPERRRLTEQDIENQNDQIRAAQARLDRARAARDAAGAELEKFAFLHEVVAWLKRHAGAGGRLAHQPLPTAKLVKGETFRQAVERIRGQLAACDERWAEIEAAPLPAADLKARITAEIDALAADGRPKIRRQDFGAGVSGVSDALRLRKTADLYISDVASPLFAWLHRDALIERLHAEVDAMGLTACMTDDERDLAFSRLLDQRLELSFVEESYICQAAAEGAQIVRRRDADPRSVLEVREVFADEFSLEKVDDRDRPARRRAPVQPAAEQ